MTTKPLRMPYVYSLTDLPPNTEEVRWILEHRTKRNDRGCWVWPAMKNTARGNYAYMYWPRYASEFSEGDSRDIHRVHRVSWAVFHGFESADDYILHKCDNSECCNPAHLEKGSQKKNQADMVRRGRSAKGEAHGMAKLDEAAVLKIYADKRRQTDIAKEFGISVPTVSDIKRGHSWSHVTKHPAKPRRN
jgi:hypothetical protein